MARAKQIGIAVLWILLYAAIGIALTIGISWAVPGWGGREWFVARSGAYEVIGFGVATYVVGRLLNQMSWERMGWRGRGRGVTLRLGRGILGGAIMAAAAIVLALLVGGSRLARTADASRWASVALPLAIGLVLAALGEELMTRGYPLRRLADATGPAAATAVLALIFGLLHVRNPSATLLSTVNVALAGVWLSFAYFSAGGMALAWGLHFGWNAGLSLAFDAPVSGYSFLIPGVEYTPGARAWIAGGAFGPEGGIVTTLVLVAGTAAILGKRARAPRSWLTA